MKGAMERTLMWCGSVIVAVAVAISFLFITFETSASADRSAKYFDDRLSKIEAKIDQLLEANN
jgi:hypothetical protein